MLLNIILGVVPTFVGAVSLIAAAILLIRAAVRETVGHRSRFARVAMTTLLASVIALIAYAYEMWDSPDPTKGLLQVSWLAGVVIIVVSTGFLFSLPFTRRTRNRRA
jgi:uncharacterized membrane protein HdeD (DUF308 family)